MLMFKLLIPTYNFTLHLYCQKQKNYRLYRICVRVKLSTLEKIESALEYLMLVYIC